MMTIGPERVHRRRCGRRGRPGSEGLSHFEYIPVKSSRPHGLDWDSGAIWCMFAGDRLVQKIDPKARKVLEIVKIAPADPDQHGLCSTADTCTTAMPG